MDISRTEFLRKLKKKGIQNNVPNISWENAEFLHEVTINLKPENLLEIGTANGFSTIWFADALKEIYGDELFKIVTIERSVPAFSESIANFNDSGIEKHVISIYGDAEKVLRAWRSGLISINSIQQLPKGPQYNIKNGLIWGQDNIQEEIPSCFDLVFIDAQKALYHIYLDLVDPLTHSQTTIIIDDVLKFPEKTKPLYTYLDRQSKWKYKTIQTDSDDAIMILQQDLDQLANF